MKEFFTCLMTIVGITMFLLGTMPWIVEYVEMYFTWARLHFNN